MEFSHPAVQFSRTQTIQQGLSKGNRIPPLGKLAISWYLGPQPPEISPIAVGTDSTEDQDVSSLPNGTLVSPQLPEEEVVTSGWGGDADDGDGMGML
jgi:RNA-binding protein 26